MCHQAVCYIKCENVGDNWHLSIDVTVPDTSEHEQDHVVHVPDSINAGSSLNSRRTPPSGPLRMKPPPNTTKLVSQIDAKKDARTLQKHLFNIASWMLFDKTIMVKTTSMDRVANCLAVRYFQSEIKFADAVYTNGLMSRNKSVRLHPDRFSVIKRKLPIQTTHNYKHGWIFLCKRDGHPEDHSSVNAKFSLKSNLATMSIPLEVVAIEDLVDGVNRNTQFADWYQGVFVHKSDIPDMLTRLHELIPKV